MLGLLATASQVAAQDALPDLMGRWTGSVEFAHRTKGVIGSEVHVTVLEQNGRNLSGIIEWRNTDGVNGSDTFSAVISHDNSKVYLSRGNGQVAFGDIISNDSVALHEVGKYDDVAFARIVYLKRSK